MQALILAAGRARRLGELGERSPKCLLDIGGRALLEYSLDNLATGGVREITIVTGHCDGAIQQHLGAQHRGLPIRYTFNPDYDRTGSVLSLLVGAVHMTDPSFLVLESDILYHPGFITAAIAAADDTLLVADPSGSGDEVYICADNDQHLAHLGKSASPELREKSLGEYAGMARLSSRLLGVYCDAAESLKTQRQAEGHYEELIFALAKNGFGVYVHHCPSLPWAEVDTKADLERARNEVFPRLYEFEAPHARAVQAIAD